MKLWLSKNSEVPMREQLITQIALGIASGDLPAGEKLPSRGEIARRFDIHPNTVSGAYRELAEMNLVEFRQGSGFFVADSRTGDARTESLEALTASFLREAFGLGFSIKDIARTVGKYLGDGDSKHFLVIEPDEGLREILVGEIRAAVRARVSGIGFEEFSRDPGRFEGMFTALGDEEEKIEPVLPAGTSCLYLRTRSVIDALKGETKPGGDRLIAVVSGWDGFLRMARTILVAARIDDDSILVRSTNADDWRRGLEQASMIICDTLTAGSLGEPGERIRPFPLISEDSLNMLAGIYGGRS